MKRTISISLILLTVLSICGAQQKNNDVGRQLFSNINLGWDVYRTSDYRSSDFHIGTAYSQMINLNPKATWRVGLNYNWTKYTLFANGNYAQSANNSIFRNQSVSFPLTANYQVHKSFFSGINVYTGLIPELIVSSTVDRSAFYDYNVFQLAWTVGTRVRFLGIFSARLAYNYYLTPLFSDGTFNRSAISFSFGI